MKLMVIDGNSIVNRSFYGVRPLTTRDGLYTNAVYGFVTTLQRLLDEESPDALCVTFDRREPTFRHLEYDGYKAQRKGMPEELAQQMPVLKEVLDAMSIPRYELAGFEADDLIGTISRKCEASGWECVAVTGDKDSLQLITGRTKVKLVSTRMGQTTARDMTPETFREAYGFEPIHIIDLKALMGDSSDNIPGVKGVGEKTAMALIRQYQTVDAIYEKLPDIDAKPGVIKKLMEGEGDARMSYDLAVIRTDAPIQFKPEDNLRQAPDNNRLYQLFLELEFSKLIDKYHLTAPQGEQAVKSGLPPVLEGGCYLEADITPEQAQGMLALWRTKEVVHVAALPSLDVVCVECHLNDDSWNASLLRADKLENYNEIVQTLFSDPAIKKAAHGVKNLCRALLAEGITPAGFVFDTAMSCTPAGSVAAIRCIFSLISIIVTVLSSA